MARRTWFIGMVALAGCASFPPFAKDEPTGQVASHPFGGEQAKPSLRAKLNYTPASAEAALRVDRVGQELLAANSQAGLRPLLFSTIGAPAPEIFHVGPGALYITEGLVKQCATDRELAAVLACELGKMVSEREAGVSRQIRDPDTPEPAPLPIGGHGYGGDADPSRVFEMAKYESRRPRKPGALARPDPGAVARSLLERAGHAPTDLQAVQPLVEAAQKNCTLEQQFKGVPPQGTWGR